MADGVLYLEGMQNNVYAMEAATYHTAALIDSGAEDYMLETAILKIFATEHLWTIVNDTIQVWGGKAYFCDQPLERWMRDARINTIGEGANDVDGVAARVHQRAASQTQIPPNVLERKRDAEPGFDMAHHAELS